MQLPTNPTSQNHLRSNPIDSRSSPIAVSGYERPEDLISKNCCCYMINRNAVKDRIRQCLGIAKRNTLSLCLALMAIDGLDLRLQQQGQEKTEQVLLELIEEIQDNLRESDWVAYWGNNEFVMVIFAPPKGAKIALERIFKAFKNRKITCENNAVIPCQGKIGFTEVQPNEHMNACLDRIEKALHRSRESDRYFVFLK